MISESTAPLRCKESPRLWTRISARSPPSEKDQRDEREKRDLGRREFWGKKKTERSERAREREREINGSDCGWEINMTDVVK